MAQKGTGPGIGTWVLIFVVIALFMTGIAAGVIAKFGWPDGAGTFGDMFGVANALFSGMAFAGLILTLIQQQKEIREQSQMMEQQRFESSFFTLLESAQNEANLVSTKGTGDSNRSLTEWLLNNTRHFLTGAGSVDERLAAVKAMYDDRGHGYRNYALKLEALLRFLAESTIADKTLYFRLLDWQPDAFEYCNLIMFSFCNPECIRLKEYVRGHSLRPSVLALRPELLFLMPDGAAH